jgi:hypothetical protein
MQRPFKMRRFPRRSPRYITFRIHRSRYLKRHHPKLTQHGGSECSGSFVSASGRPSVFALFFLLRQRPWRKTRVCFVPQLPQGCDPQVLIVKAIDGAQKSILVLMYELTARDITTALVNAKRRGVAVSAIVDKRQDHTYEIDRLLTSGVTVLADTVRGPMHNKVMIVDGATVVTGSINYTSSAEHKNAENLLLIHDPALVAEYMQYWTVRQSTDRGG